MQIDSPLKNLSLKNKKMKQLFMLSIVLLAATGVFAQKSKANTSKPANTILTNYTCTMHPEIVSNKPGKCPKCKMSLTLSKKEQMKDPAKTYVCPMHTEVVSNHEGMCAKCSSKLVASRTGSKQGEKAYYCSMHPDEKSNKQGKCSVCGMDMTEKQTSKPE
jgi:putative DNA topoisomerase